MNISLTHRSVLTAACRFAWCTIAAIALATTPAFAGPTNYEKNVVPPLPPPCDWHGFYLGFNVGVAGLQTDIVDQDYWDFGGTISVEDTNFAGGGQVGYNWQRGAFVFGLEADADYLATEKSFIYNDDQQYKGEVDFQGSLRARAGIAVDNALIYATSGVAFSHGDSRFREFGEEEVDHQETASQDEWQAGFVAGVGVEYKFNCNWSARLEALYFHYPESTNDLPHYDPGEYRWSFQNDVYTARFGINYLFGGGR